MHNDVAKLRQNYSETSRRRDSPNAELCPEAGQDTLPGASTPRQGRDPLKVGQDSGEDLPVTQFGMRYLRKMKKSKLSKGSPESDGGDCWESTITDRHYTPQGEHPEDRIHRDREYIHRLQRHIDEVYGALERDLGVKEDSNWLFDFIYNEDRDLGFEDYLSEYKTLYKDIVERKSEGGAGGVKKISPAQQ